MQNDQGEVVDLLVPRKCNATTRIIGPKDHASVQINVGLLDPQTGRFTGESKAYALSGFVRSLGESDDALCRLSQKDGIVSKAVNRSR